MIERLKEIEKKFEELTQEISKPETVANQPLFTKLARERSSLEETVKVWREYQSLDNQIKDNKEILKSNDPELSQLAKMELPELETKLAQLEVTLKKLLVPRDPDDDKDLILEIRAGTGGEEAALFAGDLLRMYQRFAEIKGWNFELLDHNATGRGGFKEVIAELSGNGAYGYLKFESGVHRVQRVPETEASGRVHTSAVTVAVLPIAEEVDITIDPKDLRIDTFRAGGAGGQHVNKTDSAIRITHIPTNVVVECQDDRSQHKNRAKAMKILRSKLYEAEKEKQEKERADTRKQMVKSGDRSEKIRTYNFPQNRLTDHRICLTLYNLDMIIDGKLIEVLDALREENAKQMLSGK